MRFLHIIRFLFLYLCSVFLLGNALAKKAKEIPRNKAWHEEIQPKGDLDPNPVLTARDREWLNKATLGRPCDSVTPINEFFFNLQPEPLWKKYPRKKDWVTHLEKKPKYKLGKLPDQEGFDKEKEAITLGLIGDGHPFQRYRYIQVSHNEECTDRPCEIDSKKVTTLEHHWRLEDPKPKHSSKQNWIDGGFKVDEKRWSPFTNPLDEAQERFRKKGDTKRRDETGVDNSQPYCSGNPGDTICLYWRAAYTSYEVGEFRHKKGQPATEGQLIDGTKRIISSPNLGGAEAGKALVCGKNAQCDEWKTNFWGEGQRWGGPRQYPYEDDFQ